MSGFKMFWVIVLAIVGGCSLLAVGNVATLDSGGFGGWIVLGCIVGIIYLFRREDRRDAAQAAKVREQQAEKAAKVRRLQELDPEWRAREIEKLKREVGERVAGPWGSASAPR